MIFECLQPLCHGVILLTPVYSLTYNNKNWFCSSDSLSSLDCMHDFASAVTKRLQTARKSSSLFSSLGSSKTSLNTSDVVLGQFFKQGNHDSLEDIGRRSCIMKGCAAWVHRGNTVIYLISMSAELFKRSIRAADCKSKRNASHLDLLS